MAEANWLDRMSIAEKIALAESLSELVTHPGWASYSQYLSDQFHAAAHAVLNGEGPADLTRGEKLLYWQGYRDAVMRVMEAPGWIVRQGEELARSQKEAKK